MGKVRYKEPSENFQKNSSKTEESSLRASVGREQSVKEYYYMSLENLIPYSKQARKVFDEADLERMAETIREHGVTSPITVISSRSNPGKFEVVSGERRLRASKIAGCEKIPCIIIQDEENAEEIALIENIQRSDLHPIEFGEALSSLLEKKGWGDVSKLAQKIGKTQSTVSEHLSYARLPQPIKDVLIARDIKSRDFLRKVVAASSQHEMEQILGISEPSATLSPKNILRVSLDLNGFHVQDRQINKLTRGEKERLKETLLTLIKKLEA